MKRIIPGLLKFLCGSTFELETQIVIAEKLHKGGDHQLLQELKTEITDEQKMLTGFQQKLNP